MRTIFALVLICFSIICNAAIVSKKRVCVIGAGRAGLAAVKVVAEKIDNFELVAFERNSDVGGIWIYRDSPYLDEHGLPAHSGTYKHLKSNIIKGAMMYPDYVDFASFSDIVTRDEFLQYIKNYTKQFQLRKYIQFDTLVTKVYPIKGNGDWKTTTWHIETQNLNTNKTNSTNCDAVMICNGHFSKPNIPKIPGFETFHGQVLHSKAYRKPEDFINKTILVLGAGSSGVEITSDLSGYAKKIYLSYKQPGNPFRYGKNPKDVQTVRGVVSANGSEFTLSNDMKINGVDTFIFCTGYSYDFPFLDERSGIIVYRKEIRFLYRDSINVKHPSMALVGMPLYSMNYGKLYYKQVTLLLDVLQDLLQLPSAEDMLKDYDDSDYL